MSESRQLAAIVFTDIAGYSQAMGNDEKYALELLKKNRSITPKIINDFKGEFLKEMGDGTLSRFTSVIDAVRCAVKIQEEAKEAELPLRIGIHIGDVIIEDSDVLGSGVNIASRIEPLAEVGGICISSDVWHQISNQTDLSVLSLGVKELKGVNEPVEIFKLNLDSATATEEIKESADTEVSLFSNLMERRFPHIIALYALLCWGMVALVSYIVNENMLSPHIINFSSFGMLSLFPTVFMLAYFHGKKGFKDFQSIEKIGIPINILGSAVFLFVMFSSKDLGAVTQSISVEDEEGQVMEMVIPKSSFIKKIAIFFFENKSEDMSIDWMHHGIVEALYTSLEQDIFIRSYTPISGLLNSLRGGGYADGRGAPFAFKQKITNEEMRLEMFITGSFTKNDDKILVTIDLHEAKNGKLIISRSYENSNIFNLVDDIANQLRFDLDLPEKHINESKFLSITDILTNSEEAYQLLIQAQKLINIDEDIVESTKYLEHSIQIDPSNPLTSMLLAKNYFFNKEKEKSNKQYMQAFKYLYKLPYKIANKFKSNYYRHIKQDGEKYFKLAKMYVEMYPDDADGRWQLGHIYRNRSRLDDAMGEFKIAYQLSSNEHEYLSNMSFIYQLKGDFDSVLKYALMMVEKEPDDKWSYINVGFAYRLSGNHEKALEYFEKALLFEPTNSEMLRHVARQHQMMGNFEKALEMCNEILSLSDLSEDYYFAYIGFEMYYVSKGQLKKAIECVKKENEALRERDYAGRKEIYNELWYAKYYVQLGWYDKAKELLDRIKESTIEEERYNVESEYANLYYETKNIKGLEAFREIAINKLNSTGKEWYRLMELAELNGQIEKIKGDEVQDYTGIIEVERGYHYQKAIRYYLEAFEYAKYSFWFYPHIAECYRKLGDYKKAREYINNTLQIYPYGASYRYESALIYEADGDMENARAEMQRALDIWVDADEEYINAKKARDKWAEWNTIIN